MFAGTNEYIYGGHKRKSGVHSVPPHFILFGQAFSLNLELCLLTDPPLPPVQMILLHAFLTAPGFTVYDL